ncbi:MAG TPA: glycosyltransferase [Pyrinomonadaceae bacterium]|nr:glycosyltransferase [Pyrinomonadaceae bacterium]
MPAENPAKSKEVTAGIATSAKVKDMSPGPVAGVLPWVGPVGLQSQTRVAVLIPAYNEELTISEVVKQFRAQLPEAALYVFDNNSADQTVALAKAAGATVFHERRQGKGYVTQSMFRQVDADAYIMVDGDNTYPAAAVHDLLEPILNGEADMVVGSRLHGESKSEFKQLNAVANRLVLRLLNGIFRVKLTDILSGYRAFNRRFVKELPLFGGGFEIETELTIKAIKRGFRIVEIPIDLTHRPPGSHSKIKFFRDGFLIINTLLALFRDYKPLTFFGGAGLGLIALALIPGIIVIVEFIKTGLVPRLPSAVLAVGLVLCGLLSITVGLILHSIARRAQEFEYQLQVLAEELRNANRQSAPGARDDG